MLNIEAIRRELKNQPEMLAQLEVLVASGALKNELSDAELESITAGKGGGGPGGGGGSGGFFNKALRGGGSSGPGGSRGGFSKLARGGFRS